MRNSCLASLVAFLLMIFLSLFILAFQIRIITSPTFITKVIKNAQILSMLPKLVDAYTLSQQETGQANLNTTALTKIIIQSIEPTLFNNEIDRVVPALLNYAQGKSQNLDINIDLTAWKQTFTQKWPVLAPPIFRAEYEKLPACKEGENPLKQSDQIPVINCQSADVSATAIEESAKTANLDSFLKTVPDEWSMADLVSKNQSLLEKIRLVFNVLNLVFWLSLVLSILSVVGLVALGWPNWRAICGWSGWVLVIATGPIFILDLLSGKFVGMLQSLWGGQINQNIAPTVAVLAEDINRMAAQATIGLAATIFGLGVVLVILSFVLPKYEPRVVPPGFKQ